MLKTKITSASLVALGVVLASSGATSAAPPPSPWSLHYQSISGVRLNPLGLITRFHLEGRLRLYDDDAPALRDNFVALSLQPVLTPNSGRLGLELAIQPLTDLRLAARYELARWFGILKQLQSFPNADADYSDSAIDAREDAAYATGGSFLNVNALARVRIGDHLVLRDTFQAVYAMVNLAGADRYFLDSVFDVIAADDGWVVSNDFDLLWRFDAHWTLGVRHTYTWTDARPAQNHRVGPMLAYVFDHETPSAFERPTLLLITGWYLEHPYRTGQDVSRAVPYLLLAFTFQGRLL